MDNHQVLSYPPPPLVIRQVFIHALLDVLAHRKLNCTILWSVLNIYLLWMFQVQHSGGFTQDWSWNMPSLFTPCASWVKCSSTKREESFSPSKWRSAKVQLLRSTGIRSNKFDFWFWILFIFPFCWTNIKKAALSSFIFHWMLPSSLSLWLLISASGAVQIRCPADGNYSGCYQYPHN